MRTETEQACPQCGRGNGIGSNFCFNCGLDLRNGPNRGVRMLQADDERDDGMAAPKERSRRVKVTLIIVAIGLLSCVSFFVWALTPGGQNQMSEFATWAAKEATRQAAS